MIAASKAFGATLFFSILSSSALFATDAALTSPEPGSTLANSTVTFTWTAGPGGYYLYVGTSVGSFDIHNSGYIAPGTLSRQVTGVPTASPVYVRLWCETSSGSGQYYIDDYTFNTDIDGDGIRDSIDPNPGVADPMVVRSGSDHILTVLGSGRVAVIESASLFGSTFDDMSTTEARGVAQRVYEHFQDDFDFIMIASNQASVPGGSYYGRFYNARNDIGGIGKSTFDSTALFGSSGQLQGAIHLTSTGGLIGGPSLHELAHNWGNSMASVPTAVGGHWGYSNIGGQLGGWAPGTLESLGGNLYRAKNPRTLTFQGFGGNANGGNSLPYSQFELYTMGLIDAEDITQEIKVANGFAWADYATGQFTATSITSLTMAEVVSTDGARTPDSSTSQKDFRVLYLILTDGPLTLGEWADFDADVEVFARNAASGGSSYNFWEATGGLATLTMDGLIESLVPEEFRIDSLVFLPGTPRTVRVSIMSELGKNYTLEHATTLSGWIDGASTAGTGGTIQLDHVVGTAPKMQFRVRAD
ncbi:hypothetical protein HAHE_04800 [Haloferula helveola]|uniref:Uncharacterized protein n=1 Tax=Haloferula helveola TaxID=490095 RepID=A0ABM7R791_9BACT|nr:hypothetical protein HAHE_04800 [Haloferula helveola]